MPVCVVAVGIWPRPCSPFFSPQYCCLRRGETGNWRAEYCSNGCEGWWWVSSCTLRAASRERWAGLWAGYRVPTPQPGPFALAGGCLFFFFPSLSSFLCFAAHPHVPPSAHPPLRVPALAWASWCRWRQRERHHSEGGGPAIEELRAAGSRPAACTVVSFPPDDCTVSTEYMTAGEPSEKDLGDRGWVVARSAAGKSKHGGRKKSVEKKTPSQRVGHP